MTLPTKDKASLAGIRPAHHCWVFAVFLLLLLPLSLFCSTPQKKAQARAEFTKAEQLRADLEAKPESKRQPADYLAVIRVYERVVQLGPTTSAAPNSVMASARLSAEMARLFGDQRRLERAIEKYRFLIKEYPHSKLVKEAREALAGAEKSVSEKAVARKRSGDLQAAIGKSSQPKATAGKVSEKSDDAGALQGEAANSQKPRGETSRIAEISNIRHWATPNYTRVVIELDGAVEYQAGRIANPDRIFFDLHGAKLGPALRQRNLAGNDGLLKRIRIAQNQVGIARIVLEVGPVANYSAFVLPNPYRLVIDINGGSAQPAPAAATASAAKPAARINEPPGAPEAATEKQEAGAMMAAAEPPSSKPVFERVTPPAPRSRQTRKERTPAPSEKTAELKPPETPAPPRVALPAKDGHRSLTRALGLKIGRIVIDPGHGGHDTGTIGPTGLMEKDLVLDVAKRLGSFIEDRLGGEVIYTRSDDTFVPLESRTALANQKQADLFVSIHANSSRSSSARGVETYYLNFTSSPDALEVAARENAVSEKSIHELQDLVKKITLKEKLDESREFASEVQKSLYTAVSRGASGMRNRGVKKAPFVVLIGANMPSILAEISFVSNPSDERLLRKTDHREKIADALYRGIQRYANSLAGVKVAHSGIGQ